MKLLFVLTLLVSCGPKKITKYIENPYDNSGNDTRFLDLENRIADLETSVTSNINQISANSTSIISIQSQLGSEVQAIMEEIDELKTNKADKEEMEQRLQELENDLIDIMDTNEAQIVAQIVALENYNLNMQTQINSNLAQIVALQEQDSVVEFIDPCGDGPGFDEVLLKTSSGKLIAYFENGGDRFLTILSPGNFRTTDSQKCNFTVNSSGEVI